MARDRRRGRGGERTLDAPALLVQSLVAGRSDDPVGAGVARVPLDDAVDRERSARAGRCRGAGGAGATTSSSRSPMRSGLAGWPGTSSVINVPTPGSSPRTGGPMPSAAARAAASASLARSMPSSAVRSPGSRTTYARSAASRTTYARSVIPTLIGRMSSRACAHAGTRRTSASTGARSRLIAPPPRTPARCRRRAARGRTRPQRRHGHARRSTSRRRDRRAGPGVRPRTLRRRRRGRRARALAVGEVARHRADRGGDERLAEREALGDDERRALPPRRERHDVGCGHLVGGVGAEPGERHRRGARRALGRRARARRARDRRRRRGHARPTAPRGRWRLRAGTSRGPSAGGAERRRRPAVHRAGSRAAGGRRRPARSAGGPATPGARTSAATQGRWGRAVPAISSEITTTWSTRRTIADSTIRSARARRPDVRPRHQVVHGEDDRRTTSDRERDQRRLPAVRVDDVDRCGDREQLRELATGAHDGTGTPPVGHRHDCVLLAHPRHHGLRAGDDHAPAAAAQAARELRDVRSDAARGGSEELHHGPRHEALIARHLATRPDPSPTRRCRERFLHDGDDTR